jgi:hypothetical protein
MNYPAASSGVSSGKDLSAASGGVLTPVLRNKKRKKFDRPIRIIDNAQIETDFQRKRINMTVWICFFA